MDATRGSGGKGKGVGLGEEKQVKERNHGKSYGQQGSSVLSPADVRVTNRVLCLCLLSRAEEEAWVHGS